MFFTKSNKQTLTANTFSSEPGQREMLWQEATSNANPTLTEAKAKALGEAVLAYMNGGNAFGFEKVYDITTGEYKSNDLLKGKNLSNLTFTLPEGGIDAETILARANSAYDVINNVKKQILEANKESLPQNLPVLAKVYNDKGSLDNTYQLYQGEGGQRYIAKDDGGSFYHVNEKDGKLVLGKEEENTNGIGKLTYSQLGSIIDTEKLETYLRANYPDLYTAIGAAALADNNASVVNATVGNNATPPTGGTPPVTNATETDKTGVVTSSADLTAAEAAVIAAANDIYYNVLQNDAEQLKDLVDAEFTLLYEENGVLFRDFKNYEDVFTDKDAVSKLELLQSLLNLNIMLNFQWVKGSRDPFAVYTEKGKTVNDGIYTLKGDKYYALEKDSEGVYKIGEEVQGNYLPSLVKINLTEETLGAVEPEKITAFEEAVAAYRVAAGISAEKEVLVPTPVKADGTTTPPQVTKKEAPLDASKAEAAGGATTPPNPEDATPPNPEDATPLTTDAAKAEERKIEAEKKQRAEEAATRTKTAEAAKEGSFGELSKVIEELLKLLESAFAGIFGSRLDDGKEQNQAKITLEGQLEDSGFTVGEYLQQSAATTALNTAMGGISTKVGEISEAERKELAKEAKKAGGYIAGLFLKAMNGTPLQLPKIVSIDGEANTLYKSGEKQYFSTDNGKTFYKATPPSDGKGWVKGGELVTFAAGEGPTPVMLEVPAAQVAAQIAPTLKANNEEQYKTYEDEFNRYKALAKVAKNGVAEAQAQFFEGYGYLADAKTLKLFVDSDKFTAPEGTTKEDIKAAINNDSVKSPLAVATALAVANDIDIYDEDDLKALQLRLANVQLDESGKPKKDANGNYIFKDGTETGKSATYEDYALALALAEDDLDKGLFDGVVKLTNMNPGNLDNAAGVLGHLTAVLSDPNYANNPALQAAWGGISNAHEAAIANIILGTDTEADAEVVKYTYRAMASYISTERDGDGNVVLNRKVAEAASLAAFHEGYRYEPNNSNAGSQNAKGWDVVVREGTRKADAFAIATDQLTEKDLQLPLVEMQASIYKVSRHFMDIEANLDENSNMYDIIAATDKAVKERILTEEDVAIYFYALADYKAHLGDAAPADLNTLVNNFDQALKDAKGELDKSIGRNNLGRARDEYIFVALDVVWGIRETKGWLQQIRIEGEGVKTRTDATILASAPAQEYYNAEKGRLEKKLAAASKEQGEKGGPIDMCMSFNEASTFAKAAAIVTGVGATVFTANIAVGVLAAGGVLGIDKAVQNRDGTFTFTFKDAKKAQKALDAFKDGKFSFDDRLYGRRNFDEQLPETNFGAQSLSFGDFVTSMVLEAAERDKNNGVLDKKARRELGEIYEALYKGQEGKIRRYFKEFMKTDEFEELYNTYYGVEGGKKSSLPEAIAKERYLNVIKEAGFVSIGKTNWYDMYREEQLLAAAKGEGKEEYEAQKTANAAKLADIKAHEDDVKETAKAEKGAKKAKRQEKINNFKSNFKKVEEVEETEEDTELGSSLDETAKYKDIAAGFVREHGDGFPPTGMAHVSEGSNEGIKKQAYYTALEKAKQGGYRDA